VIARTHLRLLLLVAGFTALVIGPFVIPHGRNRTARDPHAAAIIDLMQIAPGMTRTQVESRLRLVLAFPGGREIFAHPDSDWLRLDVRFSGPAQDATVTALSDPYLGPFAAPRPLDPPRLSP
jgi:hypothetical protein